MIIMTKKFILRPFKQSDARDIAKYINDKTIYNNLTHIPYPYKLKDAKEWLARTVPQYRKRKPRKFNLAIEISDEVVGSIGLKEIQAGHKAELGYWLAKKSWRKGIMTEAVKEMAKYGFKAFCLSRIYAHTFKHNKYSQKVLLKNGFKKEGLMKKECIKDGKYLDVILFAKVK